LFFSNATVRRKKLWTILGVIVGLVVITGIVVPTTVVLTGKTKQAATTEKTMDEISSTIKGL
jgi:flagellar basal body-associated protein FliL